MLSKKSRKNDQKSKVKKAAKISEHSSSSENSDSGSNSESEQEVIRTKVASVHQNQYKEEEEASSDSDTDKYALKTWARKVQKKKPQKEKEKPEKPKGSDPESRSLAAAKSKAKISKQKTLKKIPETGNQFHETHSSDDNLFEPKSSNDGKSKSKKGRKSFADKKKFSKFNTFRTIDERFDSLFGQEIETGAESGSLKNFEKFSSESSGDDDFDDDFSDVEDDVKRSHRNESDDSESDSDADSDAPIKSKFKNVAKKGPKVAKKKEKVPKKLQKVPEESDDDRVPKKKLPKKSKIVPEESGNESDDERDEQTPRNASKVTPKATPSSSVTPRTTTLASPGTSQSAPVGDFANYVTRTLLKSIDATPKTTKSVTRVKSESKVNQKKEQKPKVPDVIKNKTEPKKPESKNDAQTKMKKKSFNFDDFDDAPNDAKQTSTSSNQHDFASYVTRTLVKTICSPDTTTKAAKQGKYYFNKWASFSLFLSFQYS